MEKLSWEKTDALYSFLQGNIPDEITLVEPPKLSGVMAFGIIYYLQEILGIIPDHYERCDECGILFDSNYEGIGTEDGMFCDYHRPHEDDLT